MRPRPPHAWTPLFAPTPLHVIGPLRGGAQARRLRCSDGNDWAVKFLSNPQGRRILANEWIASAVARYLGINTPDLSPIWIDQDFIAANNLGIAYGTRRELITPGYHLGSQWVAFNDEATYDFFPSALLAKVHNRRDFIGALVLDKLLCNADSRQCVFISDHGQFYASFIDHGYAFNGPQWEAETPALCGLYHSADAYQDLHSSADFKPWLTKVHDMPRELFAEAVDSMPTQWLTASDRPVLRTLLKSIYSSRHTLRARLESLCSSRPTYFPNWQRSQDHPIPAARAA